MPSMAEIEDCVERILVHFDLDVVDHITEFNPDHVDEDHQKVREFVEGVAEALTPGAN